MTYDVNGKVSELLLVRMHGRAEAYAQGDLATQRAIVVACRREATLPDLAERILGRTIYAQSASRVGPLRELLQNALDASARGGRIDVRSLAAGTAMTITDRGRGMSRAELLGELLVPFQSAKAGDLSMIGEHGIGFFSVLEIAPRVELVTRTEREGSRLVIEPLGEGPPYEDFAFQITAAPAIAGASQGTSIRLTLARPIAHTELAAEIAMAAGLVDPALHRIYVDDVLVNSARSRLRHVACARVAGPYGSGDLELFVGRGEGIDPWLVIAQGGLRVTERQEPFPLAELGLHRDLARAVTAAGYGLVAMLPLSVPLNKGRSGVAAGAAHAVDAAITRAFERFILEDALFDRELLRAVDHRLASILDKLVQSVFGGEPAPVLPASPAVDESAPTQRAAPQPEAPSQTPTVAAPEEVIRFAAAVLDARAFRVSVYDVNLRETQGRLNLREVISAFQRGVLRRLGDLKGPGFMYIDPRDPLADALLRRLAMTPLESVPQSLSSRPPAPVEPPSTPMQRLSRGALLAVAAHVPGVPALAAAMMLIERVDGAIAQAAGLAPSPISVHQDLYGPDEMAHTDGTGISVNFSSTRVRALLGTLLARDEEIAFGALVDLLIHEKTHVSLASYVPRSNAEHGVSFYRRKDLLRRQLLESLTRGSVIDPIRWLPSIRRSLGSIDLPDPAELANAVGSPRAAA